jgi:putative DNA primase/helicase
VTCMTEQPSVDHVTEAAPWKMNADSLASWVQGHMINRPDAYGKYLPPESRSETRIFKVDGPVDYGLIYRHFANERIIGLYSTSKQDTSLWLAIDLDRHDGDPDDFVQRNDQFALHLLGQLNDLGFRPLLLDSNGNGGRHLFVLFDGPVATATVWSFGRWLIRDWSDFGLTQAPEVFPKQRSIVNQRDGTVGYGNYVRLLGRHYKRPHYSKVWDAGAWQSGAAAVEIILGMSGDSPGLIPDGAASYEPPPKRKARQRE